MTLVRVSAFTLSLLVIVTTIGPEAVAEAVSGTCSTTADNGGNTTLVVGPTTRDCIGEYSETVTLHPQYEGGQYGAVNLSSPTFVPPSATWPTTWKNGLAVPNGVHIGATYESLACLGETCVNGTGSAQNMTSAASEQPVYADYSGLHNYTGPSLRALEYYANFSPSNIMNGATELYWRSPLSADAANFTGYYLDIIAPDGSLVTGARVLNVPASTDTDDGFVQNGRVYYHLSGVLESAKRYRIEEWVTTSGTPALALDHLNVYTAQYQDIAGDGEQEFRIFPGTAHEAHYGGKDSRGVGFDVGYSVRFYVGLGAAGAVNLIAGNDTYSSHEISAREVQSGAKATYDPDTGAFTNGTANANMVRVVIPLKTTVPISVTVSVTPYASWADRQADHPAGAGWTKTTDEPVTGTIILDMPLGTVNWNAWSDGRQHADHYYQVQYSFTLGESHCSDGGSVTCGWVSYPISKETMPDGTPAFHTLAESGSGHVTQHTIFANPWVEVREDHDDSFTVGQDHSVNGKTVLLGIGIILGSLLVAGLILVTAPVSIPVFAVAALAATVATAGTIIGSVTIGAGLSGLPPSAIYNKELLNTFTKIVGGIGAAVGCSAMFFAPGPWKIAAGAACALGLIAADGGVDGLLDFIVQFVKLVKEIVHTVAEVLVDLMQFLLWLVQFIQPWVKIGMTLMVVFTSLWFVRETLLWIMNLLWVYIANTGERSKAYYNSVENIIQGISVPIWDTIHHKYGSIRGRYLRDSKRKGANAE